MSVLMGLVSLFSMTSFRPVNIGLGPPGVKCVPGHWEVSEGSSMAPTSGNLIQHSSPRNVQHHLCLWKVLPHIYKSRWISIKTFFFFENCLQFCTSQNYPRWSWNQQNRIQTILKDCPRTSSERNLTLDLVILSLLLLYFIIDFEVDIENLLP